MQLKIPYFPIETKMISDCVGVYEKSDVVQYIVNGLPVYSHSKEDLSSFRFITSNFIEQGLCRKVEIQRCFGVSEDSVNRYWRKFKEQGEEGFFGADKRIGGKAHKILGEKRLRIQRKLDKGQSVYSIAKEEGVRESAIRYQITQGYLKKS